MPKEKILKKVGEDFDEVLETILFGDAQQGNLSKEEKTDDKK